MKTKHFLAVGVVAALAVAATFTPIASAHRMMVALFQGLSNDDALVEHLAATPDRDKMMSSAAALELTIAQNGMEPDNAGFHLVRPTDDPGWGGPRGNPTASAGFQWRSMPVFYDDVEYQRLYPMAMQPAPNLGACLVSQARFAANAIFPAATVAQSDGRVSIVATITGRGGRALAKLIEPRRQNADATYNDWFGTYREAGIEPTKCVVVMIAEGVAYLPIDIGPLANATAGTQVTIARDLDAATAEKLVARINAQ